MFNEQTHAYISAKYYNALTNAYGENGKNTFIHATLTYGIQRGHRMAMKALRDGRPLNVEAYRDYGELLGSPDVPETKLEIKSVSPDYILNITACPWHEKFKEMGSEEAGSVYCSYVDVGLYRGFNPDIDFSAPKNLSRDGYCEQVVHNSGWTELPKASQKKELFHDFEYHCAHLLTSYRKVVSAVYGKAGDEINDSILNDFEADYGKEAANTMMKYFDTDFDAI